MDEHRTPAPGRRCRFAPTTFYGRQNVVYTVACKDGAARGGRRARPAARTATRGSAPGGRAADGALHEVSAAFELYGGPQAVNVARMGAGPAGFLIAGNRVTGAAVWTSPDGGEIHIHERAPGLATDSAGDDVGVRQRVRADRLDAWWAASLPAGRPTAMRSAGDRPTAATGPGCRPPR